MQFTKSAHPYACILRDVLPERTFFFSKEASCHLEPPHFFRFIAISQLTERNFYLSGPAFIIDMCLRIPDRVPACIPVITVIGNKFIPTNAGNGKRKRESGTKVMIAVNIYFDPVAGKLI